MPPATHPPSRSGSRSSRTSPSGPPRGEYIRAIDSPPGRPDIIRIVASNPGPLTLGGTNAYVVGRDPAHVIDPGPADPEHLAEIRAAAGARGGIGGVLLTHSHLDHTEAADRLDAPVLWGEPGRGDESNWLPPPPPDAPVPESVGPFLLVPTPGHAADHVCFLWERACFCGDLILGEGSSIVPPAALGGSLADYLASLDRVAGLEADLLCPGHGGWIDDPRTRIDQYREHRMLRERGLVDALEAGERSRARLLDAVWADVPAALRPAAALAMQAHLEKLDAEGRLPSDLRD